MVANSEALCIVNWAEASGERKRESMETKNWGMKRDITTKQTTWTEQAAKGTRQHDSCALTQILVSGRGLGLASIH